MTEVDPLLVEQAQAGDTAALDALLEVVRERAAAYATSRLRSYAGGVEAAQDVAQEATLAVMLALPGYVDRGLPFFAFVYRVTANKVNDARRTILAGPHLTDEPDEQQPDLEPGPEQHVVGSSVLAAGDRLLEALPPLSAQVVRLRGEGMSAGDVGALVGKTPTAVRIVHHRALKLLRSMREDAGL